MGGFAGYTTKNFEPHVDWLYSRRKRYRNNIEKLIDWFSKHPPFSEMEELVSLSTNIIATEVTDCHNAYKVGPLNLKEIL